ALLLAVENGHCAVVVTLTEVHAIISARGGFFSSALKMASQLGDYRMTRLLIDRGADVNMQGGYYGNPLQVACKDADLKLHIDSDADLDVQGGYYGATCTASWRGHKHIVRLLLKLTSRCWS
ncbi:hypothetical protein T440DRAFT_410119, partial [Plenodomus tracheiphilus IPT5]